MVPFFHTFELATVLTTKTIQDAWGIRVVLAVLINLTILNDLNDQNDLKYMIIQTGNYDFPSLILSSHGGRQTAETDPSALGQCCIFGWFEPPPSTMLQGRKYMHLKNKSFPGFSAVQNNQSK